MKVVLVLPTYNEKTNIGILIPRLQEVFKKIKNHDMNILVVDDNSPDGTADEVKKFQKQYKNIFLLMGEKEGLGAAYIRGFKYAGDTMQPDVLFMMDSDLSHPPELLPEFMKQIESGHDLVIGSRYIKGGGTPDWSFKRKMTSRFGNIVARLIAGLYSIHDCTSGYRAIKFSLYRQINPEFIYTRGYAFLTTLLYEMITHGAQVKEIPLVFYDRKFGETKLKTKDIIEFIQNAIRIRFKSTERMIKFAIVGGSGIVVNLGIFSIVKYLFSINYALSDTTLLLSSLCGDEISIIYNFILNHKWTFKDTTNDDHIIIKLLKFHAITIISVMINNSILFILYKMLGIPDIVAKFIGILVAFVWNYFFNSRWTWRDDTY
jgi:dolichol-phosphate mannosyltransferase